MENPVKRAFYVGVCAAAVSRKFVEQEVGSMLKKHGISEKQGKKLVEDTLKQMKKDAKHLEDAFKKELKCGVKEMKPIVHEARKLATELAVEMVKEAKGVSKRTAKKVVKKVVRKAKGAALKKAANAGRKVRTAVKVLKKVKAKVRSAKKTVRKVRKKAAKRMAKARKK